MSTTPDKTTPPEPAYTTYIAPHDYAAIKGKGLTGTETALYFYLSGRQGRNNCTWVGIPCMAANLSMPRRRIERALKGLEDKGLMFNGGWHKTRHTRFRHIIRHKDAGDLVEPDNPDVSGGVPTGKPDNPAAGDALIFMLNLHDPKEQKIETPRRLAAAPPRGPVERSRCPRTRSALHREAEGSDTCSG